MEFRGRRKLKVTERGEKPEESQHGKNCFCKTSCGEVGEKELEDHLPIIV